MAVGHVNGDRINKIFFSTKMYRPLCRAIKVTVIKKVTALLNWP